MANDDFVPVTDPTLRDAAIRVVGGNVRREGDGVIQLLRAPGRIVWPAISNAHFSRREEVHVARAFRDHGSGDAYAVALEKLLQQPAAFVVGPSEAAMHAFQQACGHFNYVLSSPDASAMVVCTTDEFLLFVGTLQFVEACSGSGWEQASETFKEYANDPSWGGGAVGRRLQAVYAACTRSYEAASTGTFVRI